MKEENYKNINENEHENLNSNSKINTNINKNNILKNRKLYRIILFTIVSFFVVLFIFLKVKNLNYEKTNHVCVKAQPNSELTYIKYKNEYRQKIDKKTEQGLKDLIKDIKLELNLNKVDSNKKFENVIIFNNGNQLWFNIDKNNRKETIKTHYIIGEKTEDNILIYNEYVNLDKNENIINNNSINDRLLELIENY